MCIRDRFYSAYIPVAEDTRLPALDTKPPLLREHRLYQACLLYTSVQGCAVAGHGYAVFAAVEQSKAQFLLHYGNGVTDGRWGQVQLLLSLIHI